MVQKDFVILLALMLLALVFGTGVDVLCVFVGYVGGCLLCLILQPTIQWIENKIKGLFK